LRKLTGVTKSFIPGDRIEPGETDAEALVREMLEEMNLTVEALTDWGVLGK
jgi:ADP-ribose pyrophosphatase YjhB (NUDIX family)